MMTETLSATTPHVIEPRERIKRYGIECIGPAGDGITFLAGHWKPGGEYIQKLIVRNVSTAVKHLKYRLPSTRYFSLAYPEEIVLSPGMFQELDVVFRPVHNDPYDDTIYFKILEGGENVGGFHVPVRAWISKLEVTAPFGLDFGFCTTHQTTTHTFDLINSGEVDSPFRWERADPFIISPMTGIIPVGRSQEITVTINPQGAHVFMVQAVCVVGEGVHAIIPEPKLITRFSAVAKFAFLSLSESKIDFGEVLSGTAPDERPQEVLLRNSSVVPAEFELYRHDNDRDEVFDVQPRKGVVPARGEVPIKVKYSALAAGSYSSDVYTFRTPGNSRTSLTCTGLAMQPVITFRKQLASSKASDQTLDLDTLLDGPSGAPTNSINFGEVEIGKITTRIFYLKNNSTRDTVYSIVADENGVFQMEPRQGVVPAQMEISVKLTFSPQHPINFYRRIWILLGEALPLFYDAYGNGFIRARGETKEQRPAPLRHAHIQSYRNRCVNGQGDLSPEDLDEMYEELQSRGDGSERTAPQFAQIGMKGTMALSVATLKRPLTRTGEAARSAVAVAHELFVDHTDHTGCQGVTVDHTFLDFGCAPVARGDDAGLCSQWVTVTNHTRGKVAVVWCAPKVHTDKHAEDEAALGRGTRALAKTTGFEKPIPESVFLISPSGAEIGSKKSMKFKITFSPRNTNRNFVNELECVAFFKNQRTFRLVNDTTLTPPWTMIVRAVGHTFDCGQLLAKARLLGGCVRNGKLTFPHCFIGDSLFQTIRLKNASNLPSTFRFETGFAGGNTMDNAGGDTVFSVRPESGEIAPEDFVLICVRFSPVVANRKCVQLLRCIVNGAVGGQLLLEGNAGAPCVVCPDVLSPMISTGQELLPIGPAVPPSGFQGVFYLKPTAVGLSSTRSFRVKNCSRLPLRFVCSLPDACDGILSVSPIRGFLKGNDECEAVVSFAPQVPEELTFKLRINIYPIAGDAPRVIDARQPGRASRVDPVQQLSMNIVAPGSGGAIVFDPPNVATPVQLVKTTERKNIVIENVSNSDLYYELYYGLKFYEEESTGAASSSNPPIEFPNAVMADGPANDEYEEHRCIYCNKPSGIIPAKSRSIVAFSVNPNRAGLFEFHVSCRLRTVDDQGEVSMVANEEDVLLRMGVTNRAGTVNYDDINMPNTFKGIENDATDRDSPSPNIMAQTHIDLPLVATIVSRASFPTVMFEDIRVENESLIADVEQLWRQFSLAPLNYELQQPLTDDEVSFNALSSPDLETLDRFSFNFTPDVIGAPRQTLMLRLRNNGFLTTSFRLHLPNEKELELEPWCDEDEPTPERLMQVCILEELKSFEIEPRHGTLEPGETCTIRVGYIHNSLKYGGVHKLPVLLRVAQGKQFWVDVIGQTLGTNEVARAQIQTPSSNSKTQELAPDTILLKAFVDTRSEYVLQNVPLGLPIESAPLQRIVLVNVSGTDACYDVDASSLRDATSANLNTEIFKVFNPRGIINARSSIILEVAFFPLEAKEYDIPLVIRYYPGNLDGGEGGLGAVVPQSRGASKGANRKKSVLLNSHFLNLSVKGLGYYPRLPKPLVPRTGFKGALPPKRQLLDLGHPMALSEDVVDFGIIPQKSEVTRVLILKNTSENKTYDYFVDDSTCALIDSGFLSVSPSYGRTGPGEAVVVHVMAKAEIYSTIIEERFFIVTQEVITAKKATRGNRLKERLKSSSSKRLGSDSHATIITRTTFSRSMQVELNPVPNGRTAKLPGTVLGSVTFSGASGMDAALGTPGKSLFSKTDGAISFSAMKGGVSSIGSNSQLSLGLQSSPGGFVNTPGAGGAASVYSPQNSTMNMSALTPAMKTPKTGTTRGNLTAGFSDMQSTASGFTGLTSGRTSRGPQTLLGPRVTLVVRVKGEVYSAEIISSLLQLPIGQSEGDTDGVPDLLNSVVLPLKQPYVAPKAIRPFSAGGSLAIAVGNLDEKSDELSVGSASVAGGLAGVPVQDRQVEAREVTTFILSDLFQDLVSSYEMEDIIKRKLNVSGGASAGGLVMARNGSGTDSHGDSEKIVGKAPYGVYINEVREAIPGLELLVDYCASKNLFVPWADVSNELHTASKTALAKQSSIVNSIDGIGFKEENTFIPTASEYFVRKELFLPALMDLGLKRKGNGYMIIKERLAESKLSFIDVKNDFYPRLEHSVADSIARKLNLAMNKRKIAEKLKRQSAGSNEAVTDASIRIQNSIRKRIAKRTVEKKRNAVALTKAREAEVAAEKERQLLRKKKRELTAEEKEENDKAKAAERIQSVARAKSARNDFDKANERSIEERAAVALCQEPGFLEIAGDVLRNTMFNIIQEAVHEEFMIESEPLKFVVKRDNFFDDDDEDDC